MYERTYGFESRPGHMKHERLQRIKPMPNAREGFGVAAPAPGEPTCQLAPTRARSTSTGRRHADDGVLARASSDGRSRARLGLISASFPDASGRVGGWSTARAVTTSPRRKRAGTRGRSLGCAPATCGSTLASTSQEPRSTSLVNASPSCTSCRPMNARPTSWRWPMWRRPPITSSTPGNSTTRHLGTPSLTWAWADTERRVSRRPARSTTVTLWRLGGTS